MFLVLKSDILDKEPNKLSWLRSSCLYTANDANPTVLRIRIRDPVLFDPWIRDEKKQIQFFDADPDPGSGILSTLDPGW
jgi:hypothetical protein